MADSGETPFVPSKGDETIVLLFSDERDRALLAEWVASAPGLEVQTSLKQVETDERPAYDLVFCDRRSLETHYDRIVAHTDAIDPVYLPVVLATTNESEDAGRESLRPAVNDVVDDVIPLPVEKAALRRRIENLLKARRASKRLAKREQQYQHLVELTPEAILLVSDRELVFANDAARELFAMGEDLVGRSLIEFVPDGETAGVTEVLAEIRANNSLEEYATLTFLTAEGVERIGTVSGVRITHGDEEATQLLIRDVTDERQRRQRLHLFGRAIDAAAQGITIADAQQEDEPLIYANEAFEQITGYSTAETLGRNCRFLQGENTEPETVRKLRRAIDAEKGVAVEILNYRRDGTPFWSELEIVPITDEGVVTHYLGLQKDVTERKEREEQLGVMSRVLRHNVRNRMNVIDGYAQQADPSVADPIRGAAAELLEISDRIREFRELTGDDSVLAEIDLTEELHGIVEGVRATYPDATLRFTAPESTVVRTHPLLCSSLGEVIQTAVEDTKQAELDLTVETDDGQVTVTLSDYGGTLPTSSLAALERGTESPLEHSRGVELWLLRWVVFHTKGDFSVDHTAQPPVVELRMPVA